jgi:regulator of sirC expression with transglutaminase-like and TPR domain
MTDKIKTMQIEQMTKLAKETGLIDESAEQAERHERLKTEEKIEQLRQLCKDKVISETQLERAIKSVKKELRYRLELLGLDT